VALGLRMRRADVEDERLPLCALGDMLRNVALSNAQRSKK